MKMKPKTIDEYLAPLNTDQRAALEKLRKIIKATAPTAQECISYGLAAFKLDGKPLVAMGASAKHCAFFPMDSTTVAAFKDELKNYDTSKGTIRFPATKPLPAALVRKLVKARIAESNRRRSNAMKSPGAGKKRGARDEPGNSQTDPAVIAFLDKLTHPLKKEIEVIRQIILGVSPKIREGIKWNAPSFRTTEYFATLNLRAKDGADRVWLILHLGAKAKDNAKDLRIADPAGLLEWLANDRCLVKFADAEDIRAKRAALEAILRSWIRRV